MLLGIGIAATALTGRFVLRNAREMQKKMAQIQKDQILSTYYRGGFEEKMTRREAGLILGENKEYFYRPNQKTFNCGCDRNFLS